MPLMKLVDLEEIFVKLNTLAQECATAAGAKNKKLSSEQRLYLAGKAEAYQDAISMSAGLVGMKLVESTEEEESEHDEP